MFANDTFCAAALSNTVRVVTCRTRFAATA
jgi:hypothetical protein